MYILFAPIVPSSPALSMKFLSGPKFQLDHAGILEGTLSSYECMQAWSSDLDKPIMCMFGSKPADWKP